MHWRGEIRLRRVVLGVALGLSCGGKSAHHGSASGAGNEAGVRSDADPGAAVTESAGAPGGTASTGGGSGATNGSNATSGSNATGGSNAASMPEGGSGGGGLDTPAKGGSPAAGRAGSTGSNAVVGGMSGHGGTRPDSGSTDAVPASFPCQTPHSWGSNVEQCATGFLHRAEKKACPRPPRRANGPAVPVYPGLAASCDNDDDCPLDSYCVVDEAPPAAPVIHCKRMCEVDSDCAADEFCICLGYSRLDGIGQDFGVCIQADCKVDAECGEGRLCIADPEPGACGIRPSFFSCQTPEDTCGGYKDCPDGYRCSPVDGRHACVDPGPCESAQGANAP